MCLELESLPFYNAIPIKGHWVLMVSLTHVLCEIHPFPQLFPCWRQRGILRGNGWRRNLTLSTWLSNYTKLKEKELGEGEWSKRSIALALAFTQSIIIMFTENYSGEKNGKNKSIGDQTKTGTGRDLSEWVRKEKKSRCIVWLDPSWNIIWK